MIQQLSCSTYQHRQGSRVHTAAPPQRTSVDTSKRIVMLYVSTPRNKQLKLSTTSTLKLSSAVCMICAYCESFVCDITAKLPQASSQSNLSVTAAAALPVSISTYIYTWPKALAQRQHTATHDALDRSCKKWPNEQLQHACTTVHPSTHSSARQHSDKSSVTMIRRTV
eukprot:14261-Heterococcus_DN1.PRE.2